MACSQVKKSFLLSSSINNLLLSIYCLSIVSMQVMCISTTTLHVSSTLAQLLQFNSLRNHLLHIVRRRARLNQTLSRFNLSFVLFCHSSAKLRLLFIKRINLLCSTASRTLASASVTSALLTSSIAFFPLVNSKGLLP